MEEVVKLENWVEERLARARGDRAASWAVFRVARSRVSRAGV